MKLRIADINPDAGKKLPAVVADDSGVGINYVDAYIKPIKLTLEDGRKLSCKRRGLKITIKLGDAEGAGLLRRLEHGPDVQVMLREALKEASGRLAARISEEDGGLFLEIDAD